MNAILTQNLDKLAEEIFSRLTLEIEASGRHVHLCRSDLDANLALRNHLNSAKQSMINSLRQSESLAH